MPHPEKELHMPTHTLAQPATRTKAALSRVACALLFALIAALPALAQTFSGLNGTVLDGSKASVKGAKVTVTSLETGTARVATTSSAGFYSFPDLLVGHYSVRVEAPGFQSELTPSVTLDATVPATVNFSLKVGDVTATVDVEAVGVELDRTTSAIGNTFDTQQLENLPINDRNYMRFTALSTGSTLFTSGIPAIQFNGNSIGGNHFYLDGVEEGLVSVDYIPNGTGRGARLSNGSQESISEFHILSNGYNAEYGRADGGIVNIISKAGTNRYHGEAYDYLRNEAFDARNFFARATPTNPRKPRFRANDFGGNFSGPIYKDKTFFFTNYEGTRQQLGVLTSGTVLSSTSRAQALAAHPALATLINNEPVGVDSTVNPQLANYTAAGINNVTENTESTRVDHNFSAKDSLFARYNYNQGIVLGPEYSLGANAANYFGINQLQNVATTDTNIALHEQHIFSPRLINDALIGYQRYVNNLKQNSEGTPLTTITGVNIITGALTNSWVRNNSFQYGDAMTLVLHQHTLKFGATFYRLQLQNNTTNTAQIAFTSVNNFIADIAAQVILSVGDPGHEAQAAEISSYVQDSWQARPNLSINYGVRWDVETTPHDSKYSTAAYSPQLGTLFPVGHQYYPVQLRSFAPRLGVAYSLTPRIVIHAGGGMYFADPYILTSTSIYANNLVGNQTLTQAGNPGLGYPYTGFTNGTAPTPSVYGYVSPRPTPFTAQYNASVERDLGHGVFAQVAYVGEHGSDLDRLEDYNVYAQGAKVRPNPNFASIFVYNENGVLSYNSLQATLKGKIKQLSLDANYTWAHAIDDSGDGNNGGNEPQDYNNIASERANGIYDQRQNVNYTLSYDIPMGTGHGFLGSSPTPVRIAASGWSINSLGIFTSGTPVNITQSVNTYGNSNLLSQRPNLVQGVPRYLSKSIDPATGNVRFFNPGAWAYPAAGSFGNSPRNPVHGPHFTDVDFSIKKSTHIHENQRLDFRAEIFNIFNHPNFAAPVAAYAPTSLTFGEINSTFGSTLGFGTSRQIQLSLKYGF
jgi:hypothetical protein